MVACRIVTVILDLVISKNDYAHWIQNSRFSRVIIVWSPGDFIFMHFSLFKISKLGVTLKVIMSNRYMHIKNGHFHTKEQPKIYLATRDFFRMTSLPSEMTSSKMSIFQNSILYKRSVTHDTCI